MEIAEKESLVNQTINIERIKNFWAIEANEALQVADHLFEKDDFSYALFFGHLAIEKILKALYIMKHRTHAPFLQSP